MEQFLKRKQDMFKQADKKTRKLQAEN